MVHALAECPSWIERDTGLYQFLNQSTDAKIFSAAARRLMSLLSLPPEIFHLPFRNSRYRFSVSSATFALHWVTGPFQCYSANLVGHPLAWRMLLATSSGSAYSIPSLNRLGCCPEPFRSRRLGWQRKLNFSLFLTISESAFILFGCRPRLQQAFETRKHGSWHCFFASTDQNKRSMIGCSKL